jgi:hypothetical protein
MMSKGSRFRPVENRRQFEDNWDKIFNKRKQYDPTLWWMHDCKQNGEMLMEKGAECNWCGLKEGKG